jgi:hypothetical protein
MKSKSLSSKPRQIHFQLSLVLISMQDPSYYILDQLPFLSKVEWLWWSVVDQGFWSR